MMELRTMALWYFIGAALVLFAVVSCDPAMADDCPPGRPSIEDQHASYAKAAEERGAKYVTQEVESKGSTFLFIIVSEKGAFTAWATVYSGGCRVPGKVIMLSPEPVASRVFGAPLAALFADEI